jgi:hypothetical protein
MLGSSHCAVELGVCLVKIRSACEINNIQIGRLTCYKDEVGGHGVLANDRINATLHQVCFFFVGRNKLS